MSSVALLSTEPVGHGVRVLSCRFAPAFHLEVLMRFWEGRWASRADASSCGTSMESAPMHCIPEYFPEGSMYPSSIYFGPKVVPISWTTLRPKYILLGYMDP